jgi:hypothetical protein
MHVPDASEAATQAGNPLWVSASIRCRNSGDVHDVPHIAVLPFAATGTQVQPGCRTARLPNSSAVE